MSAAAEQEAAPVPRVQPPEALPPWPGRCKSSAAELVCPAGAAGRNTLGMVVTLNNHVHLSLNFRTPKGTIVLFYRRGNPLGNGLAHGEPARVEIPPGR